MASDPQTTEAKAAQAAEAVREAAAALNTAMRIAAAHGVRVDVSVIPVRQVGGADHAIISVRPWIPA